MLRWTNDHAQVIIMCNVRMCIHPCVTGCVLGNLEVLVHGACNWCTHGGELQRYQSRLNLKIEQRFYRAYKQVLTDSC